MNNNHAVVSYVFPRSHRFRAGFHEALRQELATAGVRYEYIYSADPVSYIKSDTVEIDWATKVPATTFKIAGRLIEYQHALRATMGHDLVILQQENLLLGNYAVLLYRWLTGKRTALFGHGRNFQGSSETASERFKRFWSTKVHWWFAYTRRCGVLVESFGFPAEKITVFNNSVDTSAILESVTRLDPVQQEQLRAEIVNGSDNVGVYVGGIYAHKRIPFLLEAAERIRAAVPDFHLIIIGAGADAHLVQDAAARHNWIHYVGPKFGDEKTALVSLAKVFLMPGLVGLAVLDSFAYGTPMVTTDLPYHSPEIDYLEDGINGVMVRESEDADAYAKAVVEVLGNEPYRSQLRKGGRVALKTYSIEHMAERFADGVLKALAP